MRSSKRSSVLRGRSALPSSPIVSNTVTSASWQGVNAGRPSICSRPPKGETSATVSGCFSSRATLARSKQRTPCDVRNAIDDFANCGASAFKTVNAAHFIGVSRHGYIGKVCKQGGNGHGVGNRRYHAGRLSPGCELAATSRGQSVWRIPSIHHPEFRRTLCGKPSDLKEAQA